MSSKEILKEEDVKKVSGGADIKNASDKTEEENRKADIEREINRLQQMVSTSKDLKETLELMERITKLLRELEGYNDENNIIKNR